MDIPMDPENSLDGGSSLAPLDSETTTHIISIDEGASGQELVAAVLQRIAGDSCGDAIIWVSNGNIENSAITTNQDDTQFICDQKELHGATEYITLQPVSIPVDDQAQCYSSPSQSWPPRTYNVSLQDGMAFLHKSDGTPGSSFDGSGLSITSTTDGSLKLLTFSQGTSANLDTSIPRLPVPYDSSSLDIDEESFVCSSNASQMRDGELHENVTLFLGSGTQLSTVSTSTRTDASTSTNNLQFDKTKHNENEKWRRTRMKNACAMLRELVPGVGKKTEKATVYELTAQYLMKTKRFISAEDEAEFIRCYAHPRRKKNDGNSDSI